jgi:hypothetical protein
MAEEKTFKPFTIEDVRGVGDFARSYLWDVKFPEAPPAFKPWFPANDIDEQLPSVDSESAEFYNIIFSYPKKLNLPKITLTFYDREDRINFKWIRGWITNTIFNLDTPGLETTVSTLEEVVKEMYVFKLDHRKQPVDLVSYWVYPESINDHGSSDNALSIYSVPFIVAGMKIHYIST